MNTGIHTVFLEDRLGSLPEMEHTSLHPVSHIPKWIFLRDSKSKNIEINLSMVSTGHMVSYVKNRQVGFMEILLHEVNMLPLG